MKRKTINAVITKRVGAWLDTLPEEVRKIVQPQVVVTGGCIASMLLKEHVSDFDIYLKTREAVIALANHYVSEFTANRKPAAGIPAKIYVDTTDDRVRVVVKSAGIAGEDDSKVEYDYFETREPEAAQGYVSEVMDDPSEIEDVAEELKEDGHVPVFLSTNAITLSGKIQVILRFFGEPEVIHQNFDYVHCTNYWTKQEGVVLRKDALESLLSRELRYIGSRYPVCSIIRMRKFIKRGWTINAGQIVKMAFQVSQLDLNDVKVLEDQLTGVDVAYFCQVIDLMKQKDVERVDSAYLIKIIDRMF